MKRSRLHVTVYIYTRIYAHKHTYTHTPALCGHNITPPPHPAARSRCFLVPHASLRTFFYKRKVSTPQNREEKAANRLPPQPHPAEITNLRCTCSSNGSVLAHPLCSPAPLVIQKQLFFLQNKVTQLPQTHAANVRWDAWNHS
jgi:hypothetical protein